MKTNMKKLLAIAIFSIVSTSAFAQTSQGSIAISGAFGISKTTQDNAAEINQFTVNIAPSVGYFVRDGLEVGAAVGFSHTAADQLTYDSSGFGTFKTTTNTFSFVPYITKYFLLSEKVAFTGHAFAGISAGTGKISFDSDFSPNADLKLSGVQIGVSPGLSFFPTEKIGISARFGSLGYTEFSMKPEGGTDSSKSSTFGLDLNASTLALGFSYYINR
ncbi:outer membrane beta-barrel protein [Pontibacter sp. H259]|uniref:outer membrane beta-barrel protein n=1 Tax=Pontibacter sp. H259 TaxID=3133421 RepID=UPI0030C147B3